MCSKCCWTVTNGDKCLQYFGVVWHEFCWAMWTYCCQTVRFCCWVVRNYCIAVELCEIAVLSYSTWNRCNCVANKRIFADKSSVLTALLPAVKEWNIVMCLITLLLLSYVKWLLLRYICGLVAFELCNWLLLSYVNELCRMTVIELCEMTAV